MLVIVARLSAGVSFWSIRRHVAWPDRDVGVLIARLVIWLGRDQACPTADVVDAERVKERSLTGVDRPAFAAQMSDYTAEQVVAAIIVGLRTARRRYHAEARDVRVGHRRRHRETGRMPCLHKGLHHCRTVASLVSARFSLIRTFSLLRRG
jgi:hypothetical protein